MPTLDEIQQVHEIIVESLLELINRDSDILGYPPFHNPIGIGHLNRKLHEVAINHCFAKYLEICIRPIHELRTHYVDIEYNRYFDDFKRVQTERGEKKVRPDILIHRRMEGGHYLVIEAKKGRVSALDILKVKGLITDPNYSYQFGLTISYCHDPNQIIGTLYYSNGNRAVAHPVPINVPVQH